MRLFPRLIAEEAGAVATGNGWIPAWRVGIGAEDGLFPARYSSGDQR